MKSAFVYLSLIAIILLLILLYIQKDNSLKNLFSPKTTNDIATDVKNIPAKASYRQLEAYFQTLAKNRGADWAFEVLKIAQLPPNTDLHLLAHAVGDILFKQQGLKGIQICTEDFRNACSHSIVINLLLEKGEGALSQIADACRQAPGGKGAYTMCFHGLGHGVLAYNQYKLPQTVELCQKTGTEAYGKREFIECVGGAVMEIISGGGHDRNTWQAQRNLYLRPDKPLGPCATDIIPGEAKPICYIYITPYLFEAAGADLGRPTAQDFSAAFKFCGQLPATDLENRLDCFGGFGKEFIALAHARDIRTVDNMTDDELARVHEWCLLALDKGGVEACLIQALQSLYWGGENNPDAALRFCNLVKDSLLQKSCVDNLINAVSFYQANPDYRNNICQKLPQAYQKQCQQKLL